MSAKCLLLRRRCPPREGRLREAREQRRMPWAQRGGTLPAVAHQAETPPLFLSLSPAPQGRHPESGLSWELGWPPLLGLSGQPSGGPWKLWAFRSSSRSGGRWTGGSLPTSPAFVLPPVSPRLEASPPVGSKLPFHRVCVLYTPDSSVSCCPELGAHCQGVVKETSLTTLVKKVELTQDCGNRPVTEAAALRGGAAATPQPQPAAARPPGLL